MKAEDRSMTEGGSQSGVIGSVGPSAPDGAARPKPVRCGALEPKPTRRPKVKEGIKTFLWVLPLTALIWVYAEREQITTQPEVPVTIRLRTNSPDRVVTMLTPENRQVLVDLKGPLNSLEAVRDGLADNRNTLDVTIPDDVQLPYRGPVGIAESIERNPLLVREAVTVSRVRPATVTVLIEKKESITVPVQIRSEDLARIGGTVEFATDRVVVEGPASVLEGPKPEVFANMKKVLDLTPGPHTVDIPVEVVGSGSASMTPRPAMVKAVVNIKPPEERTLRQSIPVLVLINGATLESGDYQFKVEPKTLPDIKVVGPLVAMEELDKRFKDDRLFPAAIVDLAPRDVIEGIEKPILRKLGPNNFRMPKGVAVTNTDLEVRITVVPKSGV